MKIHVVFFVATLVGLLAGDVLADAGQSSNIRGARLLNNGNGNGYGRTNRRAPQEGYVLTEPCRVAVRDVQCLDESGNNGVDCGTRYDCEPSLVDTDGIGGLAYEIPEEIIRGNEDKIDHSGGTQLSLPGLRIGKNAKLEKSNPNGVPTWSNAPISLPGQTKKTRHRNLGHLGAPSLHRQLNPTIDDRTVLVVRIKGADATTSKTEAQLSDDVFGICSDPNPDNCDQVNLRSQYKACSYNQLNFELMANTTCATGECPGSGAYTGGTPAINGVTTVVITDTISGASDGTIRNAANTRLQNQFGVTLPCLSCNNDVNTVLANHVMFCIPSGTTGGWIGYAWYNAYASVYNNNWCTYTSIQMHEIGHNMELAHSGEVNSCSGTTCLENLCSGSACTYGDKSGFMGYSYSQDDQSMCFNAPKNWQLGWYVDGHIDVDPISAISTHTLYGIVDYDISNGASTPVMVRIQTATNALSQDYYVSYNRKIGFNSQSAEGANRVLVHKRNRGTGRAESKLLAILGNGSDYFIQDNGVGFYIRVTSLTTTTSPPGTATIEIGEGTLEPTSAPTSVPTSAPTPNCYKDDCTVSTFDTATQQCVDEPRDCTGNSCTVDSCLAVGGCQNEPIAGCTVGETGQVTLDATVAQGGHTATVTFRKEYAKPVVVAFINTRNASESVAPRVKDVTGTSCKIFMEEPPSTYSGHAASELVSYIVIEQGLHELAGGLVIEAGVHTTSRVRSSGQNFEGDAISFQSSFPSSPAVLHTLQTHNNNNFMTSLGTAITFTGFQIAQEALETGTQSQAVEETIGWIALATGSGTTNNSPYIIGFSDDGAQNGVGQAEYMIDLAPAGFTSAPDVVVSLIGENGKDGSYARGSGTYSLTQQGVFAEEDQTKDSERGHASEPFAWAVFPHETDLRLPDIPSESPSSVPTASPVVVASDPPSDTPSQEPSTSSAVPSSSPSRSASPSDVPSKTPTALPSSSPSLSPSMRPSSSPSSRPTVTASALPTVVASDSPSSVPTVTDSNSPSSSPSKAPTDQPSAKPSSSPTSTPTESPEASPSSTPSKAPSEAPSFKPSSSPTGTPTESPEASPSASPSTPGPTTSPEASPSSSPSEVPSGVPSDKPSSSPTTTPTTSPEATLSSSPSKVPTKYPTTSPNASPSSSPSNSFITKYICSNNFQDDTRTICNEGTEALETCVGKADGESCGNGGRVCYSAPCDGGGTGPSPTPAPVNSGPSECPTAPASGCTENCHCDTTNGSFCKGNGTCK